MPPGFKELGDSNFTVRAVLPFASKFIPFAFKFIPFAFKFISSFEVSTCLSVNTAN